MTEDTKHIVSEILSLKDSMDERFGSIDQRFEKIDDRFKSQSRINKEILRRVKNIETKISFSHMS